METAKWKATAAAAVGLAASGTAPLAAYVHRQVQRPQSVRQQRTIPRAADAGVPCAAPAASPPRYLFSAQGGVSLTNPSWLSATRLLGSSNRQVSSFDMVTGRDTSMENVNAVIREQEEINAGHLEMFFDASFARLSPDGRWLLWPSGTREAPTWEAMTLDGSERREWDRDKNSPAYGLGGVAWMQDSIHWVEVGQRLQRGRFRAYVRVYDMGAPRVDEFPVRQTPKPDALLPGSPQFIFTTDGRAWLVDSGAATVTPSGVLLSSLDYYQLLPGPDVWTLRHTSFPIQAAHSHYTSDDCKLSPDGQWLVWRDNSDWGKGRARIILSRPDGTAQQILFEATTSLGLPCWTPDQQKIIFHWQGNSPLANVPGCDGVYAIPLAPLTACSRPLSSHGPQQAASAGPFPVAVGRRRPAMTATVAGR